MTRNEMILKIVTDAMKEASKYAKGGDADDFVRMLGELFMSSDEEIKSVLEYLENENE